jgi:hypothetical protein
MDMTDNELLEKLFSEARQMEVADNGFTQRVMQQLPQQSAYRPLLRSRLALSRLWTVFCILVAVVLFVMMRGWELITFGLLMLANNLQAVKDNMILLLVLAVVGGLVCVSEVVRRERYSVI